MPKTPTPTPPPGGEVVLDFSSVKGFEPLDPGIKYKVLVTKLDLSKTKDGKPKSHCELTIESPDEVQVEEWVEDDNSEGGMRKVGMLTDKDGNPVKTKAKGRILFREFSLEPQALPFLHEFIRAVDPNAKLDDKFRYNPQKYMGLEAAASVYNEAYEGTVNPRVRRMYPASKAS